MRYKSGMILQHNVHKYFKYVLIECNECNCDYLGESWSYKELNSEGVSNGFFHYDNYVVISKDLTPKYKSGMMLETSYGTRFRLVKFDSKEDQDCECWTYETFDPYKMHGVGSFDYSYYSIVDSINVELTKEDIERLLEEVKPLGSEDKEEVELLSTLWHKLNKALNPQLYKE